MSLPAFRVAAQASGGPQETSHEEAVEESTRSDPAGTSDRTSDRPEASEDAAYGTLEVNDILMVTGGSEAVESLPGSGHFVGSLELARHQHSDIHRVLQQIEGVNVQEEDGFGLRPNIGMRGTGVNRSEKITLLEDGILIAPAPYTAPAAYYFPNSERMEAVEVRKGSSAVTQGPYTTGGVLNLVSRSIPSSFSGSAKLAGGSHGTIRSHGILGTSRERIGWLVEGYHLRNRGFKELDGGGSTGVELADLVAKARWNSAPDARAHQSLEIKLGRTKQEGQETYLGLTERDFERTPFRRYAASQEDFLDTDHDQIQLRYLGNLGPRVVIAATAYRNTFFRNWHKLQSVSGLSLAKVLDNPSLYADEHALLGGEIDGVEGPLAIRNNRRDYLSQGVETRMTVLVDGSRVDHEIEIGLRAHRDEEDRFQEEDLWNMISGQMQLTAIGDPGSQANRVSRAEAHAAYLSDTIRFDDWTLTPGVRVERIDFETLDYGVDDPARLGDDIIGKLNGSEVLLPGLGASYRLGSDWNFLAGVHRGFSAPGPGQDPETDSEESLNYELGFNYRSTRGSRPTGARLVGFWNDYDNLIGRDSLSGGGEGTSRTFNGGEAIARGVEVSVDTDLGSLSARVISIPVRVGYTLTQAEFVNSFDTRFTDWAPRVSHGDRMPYLPEHQASLSIGCVGSRWEAFLAAAYTGKMRTKPGQGPIADSELIDRHVLVDLTARVDIPRNLGVSLLVRNLLNETYVASRRPAGLRPGLPRTILVGLSWGT